MAGAAGKLYVVATPIGNLEDITLRALRVLKEADLIAAEDTRRTRKLLSHYSIATPMVSYHAHSPASRAEELMERLRAGAKVALVSDAGTPGFSDPGADLVARAWEAGVKVEAVPGPAAAVAALSVSGFKGDVTFVGFLPRGAGRRVKLLQELAAEARVLIIFESPRRAARTLAEIAEMMPHRRVLVVRELTKKFEEAWRGPAAQVAAQLAGADLKGEVALVLSCPEVQAARVVDLKAHLLAAARETGFTGRRLAEAVAAELQVPRRRAYQAYLALKDQKQIN